MLIDWSGRAAQSLTAILAAFWLASLIMATGNAGATSPAQTGNKKESEQSFLLYFQPSKGKCQLAQWSPVRLTAKVLLVLDGCPDDVFVDEAADTLITVRDGTVEEIRLKPQVSRMPVIRLPHRKASEDVYLAGHLKHGLLSVVFVEWGLVDDYTLKVFAVHEGKWKLMEQKPCRRFDECLEGSVSGRRWSTWRDDKMIWHPDLNRHPLVTDCGVATLKEKKFTTEYRGLNSGTEKGWHYVDFLINQRVSTLYYFSEPGDGGGAGTFDIYLKTDKDAEPVLITKHQSSTAILSKYLLIDEGPLVGPRLIDLETGQQPIKDLKFPFWIYR